ncbi:MAG TPA: FAD-dependent oxidoreductase [Euryarchaeota archaeon]|nr:FAD-dependent oxidoreductase [Euryarchaeota archaeon]
MDLRIKKHPLLDFTEKRQRKVKFYFDGKEFEGYESEPIAVALYANNVKKLSTSAILGRPRGLFCAIGKCASCRVVVNGIPNVRACQEPVREGIRIMSSQGLEKLEVVEEFPPKMKTPETIETEILVIGSGPAGAMAALKAADLGAKVLLVDYTSKIGGQLVKQTHKFFGWSKYFAGTRGTKIAKILEEEIKKRENIEVWLESPVVGYYEEGVFAVLKNKKKIVFVKPKRTIIAPGAVERFAVFENNDLPGIMGAGGAQTLMNVWGVKPGNKVLVVGSGNVGLIVSYQMAQAGIKVVAIVEALPSIGGYFVHAAKVRRLGIPILTKHTIIKAEGEDSVKKAIIAEINEKWEVIPGTEKEFDVDAVIVAVGMYPDTALTQMIGAKHVFVKELGGFVPLRTKYLETSVKGVYIAGDVSCIEEASTALMEGIIAGISAAFSLGYEDEDAKRELREVFKDLDEFRAGPRYIRIKDALKKVIINSEGV